MGPMKKQNLNWTDLIEEGLKKPVGEHIFILEGLRAHDRKAWYLSLSRTFVRCLLHTHRGPGPH